MKRGSIIITRENLNRILKLKPGLFIDDISLNAKNSAFTLFIIDTEAEILQDVPEGATVYNNFEDVIDNE